jgi:hypothetical protein
MLRVVEAMAPRSESQRHVPCRSKSSATTTDRGPPTSPARAARCRPSRCRTARPGR